MLKVQYPTVHNRLRALREERGLAQYGLVVLASTSPTTILAIERYGHCPQSIIRERIASALGVTVSDIWPEPDVGAAV
jgi:DNA-binding XRE family transcriptional regulator